MIPCEVNEYFPFYLFYWFTVLHIIHIQHLHLGSAQQNDTDHTYAQDIDLM